MLAVVLMEMAGNPAYGKGIALIHHCGAVVINESALEHRDESVVAKTSLNDAFSDDRASDMPGLSALVKIELKKARASELPRMKGAECMEYVKRCIRHVLLHACLPRHSAAAALIRTV